ncbi:gamma-butyrobetaine hydroxylase-like domain-containing protein [Aestuariispira insulae]|uniref:DUF971 family protein n=1 Tax=Aestuariispira insulae TaxID=1461337 RepID=A0A3D9HPY1_9PROT|nr:DUF971 domain-containing protein [Aestuariispira insulae]RED51530.1 DUF971 family protein [Aestuariispira insulae]
MGDDLYSTKSFPTKIHYRKQDQVLEVTFDDGNHFELPAEYLRVESPSAEVQGHHPDQKVTVSGRRQVGIIGLEPVGRYAVRIQFDDLHDSGIYSWQYLYELGHDHDRRWQAYLADLEAKGLTREP